MLALLGTAIYALASLYLLVMFARMIVDWVRLLVPAFSPKGGAVVVLNLVYALTDPPISWLRRRIPPLRLGGGIALDMGFMVLFVAVVALQWLGRFVHGLGL